MSQQKELEFVIELIAKWISKIRLNNAIGFYDINKISEDVALNLLNLIYDYELVNLNEEKSNFTGIDLGDKNKSKIAFQVTSRVDFNKIKTTLNHFVDNKNDYSNIFYNGIKFLILNSNKVKSGKKELTDIYKNFNLEKDIISEDDLIKEIKTIYNKDQNKFKKIKSLLDKSLGSKNKNITKYFWIPNIQNFPSVKNTKDDKLEILLNTVIPKYLLSLKKKFQETKTFFSSNKQNFYDVYFPIPLKVKNDFYDYSDKGEKIYDVSVDSLFNKSNFITIFGVAGSGKSTLIKHLFLNSIEKFHSIPIVVELRKLNNFKGSIIDFICKDSFYNELNSSDQLVHDFFGLGKILFMFDGYDEIYSDNVQRIISEIESFVDTYDKNKYIMTSRPGTNIELISRFDNLYVLPLRTKDVISFIKKQVKNTEFENRLIESINNPQNKDYIHYLSNPLLLSMYILNFRFHPEIPKKKSKFYSNVFDTLYQRHDGESKNGFPREKVSKLDQDKFETVLKIFSYISYFEGVFLFDRSYLKENYRKIKDNIDFSFDDEKITKDFEVALSIFVKDGVEYRFPHRSLQEYFTSMFIKEITSEDTKKKIYTSKFNQLKENYADSLYNLLELCYELDKVSFLSFFIIPKIEDILNRIDDSDENTVYKSLVKVFNIEFLINNEKKHIYGYSVLNNRNLFEFLKIDSNLGVSLKTISILNNILFTNPKYNIFVTGQSFNFIEHVDNEEFKSFYKEYGFFDSAHIFYIKLKEKLLLLQNEIQSECEKNINILNLI